MFHDHVSSRESLFVFNLSLTSRVADTDTHVERVYSVSLSHGVCMYARAHTATRIAQPQASTRTSSRDNVFRVYTHDTRTPHTHTHTHTHTHVKAYAHVLRHVTRYHTQGDLPVFRPVSTVRPKGRPPRRVDPCLQMCAPYVHRERVRGPDDRPCPLVPRTPRLRARCVPSVLSRP